VVYDTELGGDFTATTEVAARRRLRVRLCGSFGLYHTARRIPFVGGRDSATPHFGDIPVRAVQDSGDGPKAASQGLDSSHGVHRCPFTDMTVICVHSRLDRRPDFGEGLPRPSRVPSLSFLPTSTVFSAEPWSEDRGFRRSAGLLHPAAGHGVRQVSMLPYGFWPPADVVGPRFEALSHWRRPFEAFSSPVAVPLVTAASFRRKSLSRESVRVHRGAGPSRRWIVVVRSVLPRIRTPRPRPQGFAPPKSPLPWPGRFRPGPARCSHGLWIDPFGCLPRRPFGG